MRDEREARVARLPATGHRVRRRVAVGAARASTERRSSGHGPSSSSAPRTATHAGLTAPPAIHVRRDADAEPAEPIRVSAVSTLHVGDAQLGARDLLLHAEDALPDLRRGGVDLADSLAVPRCTRTRAVAGSSKPSENAMFLKPAA